MNQAEHHIFHNKSSMDLYPVQCGWEACTPLHRLGPTQTHNYLFHYILSGKGYFSEVGEQAICLHSGQGFLIPPNRICSYESDEDDPWTYYWVEFNGLKAPHLMQEAGLGNTNLIFISTSQSVVSDILAPLQQLIHNPQQHEAFLIGQLYLMMNSLIRFSRYRHMTAQNETHSLYIREALHYIQDHYAQAISIDAIAQHCNLNRHYFSKLFKKEMHITPSQYVLEYRMTIACQRLTSTQDSIQAISEQVGYTNQFNFSVAFKRTKGIPPIEWRKHYT